MKPIIILFIAFVCIVQTNAQVIRKSNDFPPPWRSGDMPKVNTQTYYLKEFQGEGKTLTEARDNAILGLISDIAQNKGVTVTGSQLSEIKAQSLQGNYSENEKTTSTYKIQSDGFYASFELMDVYWEESRIGGRSEFYCWALFEVALDPSTKKFDKIQFTTDYGFAPVLKSAIVPGWGQFSKMQKIKGYSIFGAEAILLGVGLVAENMRISNINRSKNTRDVKYIKQYLNDADSNETLRNISFATAGAVYVYNLIDAAVSKGAKHYVTNNHLSLIPCIDSNSAGMSLVYNFK